MKLNNSRKAASFRLFQNLIAYSHIAKKIIENILCQVFNGRWRHIHKGLLFRVDKGWNNHLKVEALLSISKFWYGVYLREDFIRQGRLIKDLLKFKYLSKPNIYFDPVINLFYRSAPFLYPWKQQKNFALNEKESEN